MVKKADKNDLLALARLAVIMWNKNTVADLEKEFSCAVDSENSQCFIKYVDNKPIGFAMCQLRHDCVEGTNSSPVGYLEGIFILEEYRHKGYAKQLLTECEKWAFLKGCKEFASDCEIDNKESLRFHMAVGFNEVGRIICFTKKL